MAEEDGGLVAYVGEYAVRRLVVFLGRFVAEQHSLQGHVHRAASGAFDGRHGSAYAAWRTCEQQPCKRARAVLDDVGGWPLLSAYPVGPHRKPELVPRHGGR